MRPTTRSQTRRLPGPPDRLINKVLAEYKPKPPTPGRKRTKKSTKNTPKVIARKGKPRKAAVKRKSAAVLTKEANARKAAQQKADEDAAKSAKIERQRRARALRAARNRTGSVNRLPRRPSPPKSASKSPSPSKSPGWSRTPSKSPSAVQSPGYSSGSLPSLEERSVGSPGPLNPKSPPRSSPGEAHSVPYENPTFSATTSEASSSSSSSSSSALSLSENEDMSPVAVSEKASKSVRDHATRYAIELGIGRPATSVVKKLSKKFANVAGKQQRATAAGVVMFVSHLLKKPRSVQQLAEVAEISKASIQNVYRHLYATREALIEPVWIEGGRGNIRLLPNLGHLAGHDSNSSSG